MADQAKLQVGVEFDEKSTTASSRKVLEGFKGLLKKLDAEISSRARRSGDFVIPSGMSEKEMERSLRRRTELLQRVRQQTDREMLMHFGGSLSPLPGGHLVNQVMSGGLTGSARRGMLGGSPLLGFVGGGLKAAGWAGLGLGVLGSVLGSQGTERLNYTLGQAVGGRGVGRGASLLGARAGLLDEEMLPIASALGKGTGGLGGLSAVLRSQQAFGLGHEGAALFGAMSRTGASVNDAQARKVLTGIIGAGTAQGLKQGRFGELIEGVTAVVSHAKYGVGPSQVGDIARALSSMPAPLRGAAGGEALMQVSEMLKGTGSPLSRSIAMQVAGLSGNGGNYFSTLRRMKTGLFAEGGMGWGDAQSYFKRMRDIVPDDEFRWSMLGQHFGDDPTKAKMIEQAALGGNETSFRDLMKSGKSKEDQAYDAMIETGKNWREFRLAIQQIEKTLGDMLSNTGLLNVIATGIRSIDDGLRWITTKMGRTEITRADLTYPVMDADGNTVMVTPGNGPDLQKTFTSAAWQRVPDKLRAVVAPAWEKKAHDLYGEQAIPLGQMPYTERQRLMREYVEGRKRGLLTGYDVPESREEVELKNGYVEIKARFVPNMSEVSESKNGRAEQQGQPPATRGTR